LLTILKTILPSVLKAGEEVLTIYNSSFSVSYKKKDDPLTQADLLANRIISEAIQKNFPQDYILSEEEKELPNRRKYQNIWLIDPIDGTREFVKKSDEFAISVGLCVEGIPKLGIILNPAKRELFIGIKEWGVTYSTPENPDFTHWNQILKNSPTSHPPTCLVSNSEFDKGSYSDNFWKEELEIKPVGSIAYKLALLSAGKSDLCISLKPKSDWDIGAGVALVIASGGICQTILEPKEFNFSEEKTEKQGIFAGKKNLIESILLKYSSLITSKFSNYDD
jgi:3'-phosphoadenosine 5'-phosphosulfate (PAPS) 3'-phosphatase